MPSIKFEGGTVEVDDNGYLKNIKSWNGAVALALAKKAGMRKLSDDQMDILKFLREYYEKFNAFPILRMVCSNLHKPKSCMTKPFGMDPLKAWKIAGLPQPNEEVIVYLQGPPHPEK